MKVTLGVDLCAYAEIDIDCDTKEAIGHKVVEMMESDDPPVFDEDWSTTSSLRIVSARDDKGNVLIEGKPIEPITDSENNEDKSLSSLLLAALNLIEVDKDGDGFICREAMDQVREAIASATKGNS